MTTVSSNKLSDYEKLRYDNVKRNNKRLHDLGLDKRQPLILEPPKKKNKTRKASLLSLRRSSRSRKQVQYGSDVDEHNNGSDDDYDSLSSADSDENIENDNESDPVRQSESRGAKKQDRTEIKAKATNNKGITCENAKTGRSTCRKCRVKIEKDSPRIGMEAWIMGRQSITWQCPCCFLGNLKLSPNANGRSRCKATGKLFEKGELKVGVQSHTATMFYKVSAVETILDPVVRIMSPGEWEAARNILGDFGGIEGSELLNTYDREKVLSVLKNIASKLSKDYSIVSQDEAAGTPVKTELKSSGDIVKESQPKIGTKTNMKGKVEWKFAGHICKGNLIPGKETQTHCYARTHKGNVKILAKGKDYWSIIS